jgi:hypothetical protein
MEDGRHLRERKSLVTSLKHVRKSLPQTTTLGRAVEAGSCHLARHLLRLFDF